MKNRLSFRAYIKKEQSLYPVSEIDYENETVTIGYYSDYDLSVEYGYNCKLTYYDFDDVELMQCTGIKDIKGKLISEGDIFKDQKGVGFGVVKYGEYKNPYINNDLNIEYGFFIDWNDKSDNITRLPVIYTFTGQGVSGNIYENPELLQSSAEE